MLSLLIEKVTQTYKNNIQVFMKSPFPFKVETFCFSFPPRSLLFHTLGSSFQVWTCEQSILTACKLQSETRNGCEGCDPDCMCK